MASTAIYPSQFAFRSLKATGISSGPPDFQASSAYQKPTELVKIYRYSADGRFFGLVTASGVQVLDAETQALVSTIEAKGIIDIAFSPKGTQVSTWERHVKPAEGEPPHRNLRVWDVKSASEIFSLSQKAQEGWALQYNEEETKAVRVVTNEVHVYNVNDFSAGIADKLRIEGVTECSLSPGSNPSVAVFIAEKKGAPASVRIHSLSTLSSQSGAKTFYKADKIQMKWNNAGTNLLFLTQTDVDKTGKSYYGETNLYMMAASGIFDCRVTLDKEGGIHDFAWSPNDREFSVTYGYMPAKTVIFDQRVNIIHDFGTQPRNHLAYNPQGRLLCIAGFGNLAGQVDIWDRKTLKKVTTIDARNTSYSEWSPDGRFLMCATLSPRLRVDNGIKIYHFTGGLMFQLAMDELYQTCWRPSAAANYPFGGPLDSAPPHAAIIEIASATPVKPIAAGGAYRPPHARGTLTPTLYRREDEGGAAYNPNDGVTTFATPNNGRISPSFASRGRRTIPGAAPVEQGANSTDGVESRRKKKSDGKKKNGHSTDASGATTPQLPPAVPQVEIPVAAAAAAALEASTALSANDKKRRALQKKLTAIDQLKEKKSQGEKLELTQHKKLDSEAEIRKELAALDIK